MADEVELTARDAVVEMINKSGANRAQVSCDIGKSKNYVSVMVHNGTTPSTALLSRIAKACGYRMQLVGHGSVIDVTDE